MGTKVKRIPNVFESLYLLAKHDNYDSGKWRDVLTGIHRKYKDKQGIRDMCLLYYGLFKGHTNDEIAHMEIRYKDRESRECQGPFKIGDIAEAYLSKVSALVKFMNTKQLAIISKYLSLFNKLNESLCSTIVSRMSLSNLKITARSFCNIVLALSESNCVNRDVVERLLVQNKNMLVNMNKIDLMYVLKSISIHNINNEEIMSVIADKLSYYTEDMSANEVLSTLYAIYRLNWQNEQVVRSLYFKTQNLINEYDVSSLGLIAKYLSHCKLKDVREFFDVELIPRAHQLVETDIKAFSKTSGKNNDGRLLDELLLLYKCCYSSGSTLNPKMLNGILDGQILDYQWQSLFTVLNRYQHNINCSRSLINSMEYVKLVLKSIEGFKGYISANKVSIKYMPEITRCMVESGCDRNDVLLEIVKGISEADVELADHFLETLFNLHTVDLDDFNTVYNELLSIALRDRRICDYGNLVPLMSILCYRNEKIPPELDEMFKAVFNKGGEQTESWKVQSPEYSSISSYKRHKVDTSDEVLEYLAYTMVFPMRTTDNASSGSNSGSNTSSGINTASGSNSGSDDTTGSIYSGSNGKFLQYKEELTYIFKMIKKVKREDLVKMLVWYIGKMDEKLLKRMVEVGSIPWIREVSDTNWIVDNKIKVELVNGMERLLVKLDEELVFGPCYLESGAREVCYNQVSREKWDSVAVNMLRRILELNSYGLKVM
ncbi:conserved hypothetical protein [Theileria orientalis strain Shintoku]|uniref:RNA-editing substrate-binding complex 6 protein domain-containing protein n=1 Tax=Theileria orientalis strain Shintoku TaxID=869250 RepID=J4CCB0_THEOR|nr:conserved hypothetical protein [Theileria orientalis strain Shintoku]BAM39077.1 conserved hypothetical protein [Theileria orientalis strain Shintoku]|eukprot:XP_009689378.1 conserved hypothetical protein [Theileria orientalis strain Shintoku]